MLLSALQENQGLGDWAKWVRDSPRQPARETRQFLELCFANIPPNKHLSLCRRIGSADKDNVDAAFYELVAHELFRRLHLEPQFGPKLAGARQKSGAVLTPDMMVKVGTQDFIVEVFLTRNPIVTHKPPPLKIPGVEYTEDRGERVKKIWDTVLDKYHKYSPTGKPMILVVFLGDHWVETKDVQTALYGAPVRDGWLRNEFPHGICGFRQEWVSRRIDPPSGGAMLPDESGQPGCPRLSAVIACYWFDTLNRSRPGKRLHCLVLHHWSPDVPMQTGQFGEFGEISWSSDSSGHHRWDLKGSLHSVARFHESDRLEFGDYDWRNPW